MTGPNIDNQVQRAPLAAHPAFRPIVSVWLAALAGLGVLVLTNHPLQAAGSAICGAALGWLVAQLAARYSSRTIALRAKPAQEQTEPIEWREVESGRPAFIAISELGLASFETENSDNGIEQDLADFKAAFGEALTPDADESTKPFTSSPGKNAALVLKRQPIDQMSIVQMIERLAHSLHDRKAKSRHNADWEIPVRPNPALIAKLRTQPAVNTAPLSHYATEGNAALAVATSQEADETERALRDALEKLQRMSGGA